MDFSEALRLMKAGKKVRRKCWAQGDSVRTGNGGFVFNGAPWMPGGAAILAEDWEVFNEITVIETGSRFVVVIDGSPVFNCLGKTLADKVVALATSDSDFRNALVNDVCSK